MINALVRRVHALPAALAVATACAPGCAVYGSDRTESIIPPPRATFAPLGGILEAHCGTLDCHGSPARNLRIYGVYGMRANGSSVTGGSGTTEQDVDATYESAVGVDPENLGAVFAAGGHEPERWLVVRKSRGLEHHAGGAPLASGSAGDRCLIAWLSGAEDGGACVEDVFGPEPREGETW